MDNIKILQILQGEKFRVIKDNGNTININNFEVVYIQVIGTWCYNLKNAYKFNNIIQ